MTSSKIGACDWVLGLSIGMGVRMCQSRWQPHFLLNITDPAAQEPRANSKNLELGSLLRVGGFVVPRWLRGWENSQVQSIEGLRVCNFDREAFILSPGIDGA